MTKCVLCDIDGTLADIQHRRHYVASKPKNWPAFKAGIKNDTVIEPVLTVIKALAAQGLRIVLTSGRGSEQEEETITWLNANDIPWDHLYMRAEKDYRPDDIVKLELLEKIKDDGFEPLFVFDDRKRVKRAWVSAGMFVFDVNQTDAEF